VQHRQQPHLRPKVFRVGRHLPQRLLHRLEQQIVADTLVELNRSAVEINAWASLRPLHLALPYSRSFFRTIALAHRHGLA
jgi:hypothetical protein